MATMPTMVSGFNMGDLSTKKGNRANREICDRPREASRRDRADVEKSEQAIDAVVDDKERDHGTDEQRGFLHSYLT